MLHIKSRSAVLCACAAILLSVASLPTIAAADEELSISFADPAWDGKRIPKGQQCKKFGGNGATPALKVSNIPADANAIIVEFNDNSFAKLSSNGGHGKVGWRIAGGGEAVLKSVPGGTDDLPEGTWLVKKNRATGGWYSPGYLPPCSGGSGNTYVGVVKAVKIPEGGDAGDAIVLAEGKFTLGRY